MTESELVARLHELATLENQDEEGAHADADRLLLEFIDRPAVTEAFDSIPKWYA